MWAWIHSQHFFNLGMPPAAIHTFLLNIYGYKNVITIRRSWSIWRTSWLDTVVWFSCYSMIFCRIKRVCDCWILKKRTKSEVGEKIFWVRFKFWPEKRLCIACFKCVNLKWKIVYFKCYEANVNELLLISKNNGHIYQKC